MFRFLVLWTLVILSAATYGSGLEGDPKALHRVEMMFDAIGGRDAWANARSLYTMERARHPAYGDGIIASYWRDLEFPGEYGRLVHKNLDVRYGWDDEQGWISRDGELRDFSDDEMAEHLDNWGREIYTLYHQPAKGERELTVRAVEPNGFTVLNEQDKSIGEFRLTPSGDLYFWQQLGGNNPVAYVYGPHKDFGDVSFPDWGTATDGGWGFYYLQVKPSEKSFRAHIDLTKPKTEWGGGALKKDNCRE